MDHEKQSNYREAALLVVLGLTYYGYSHSQTKFIEMGMKLAIIGILFPKAFRNLSKILKFLGPKVHAVGSYIILNVIFVILVIPVGIIKNIFSRRSIETNSKIYSKQDFERPF
jgi:hypothetical protein